METYNHTTYAILGILTTDCKSGYAIKQLIDQSLNHFWKISYGQIYPTLKLIVEEELAIVRISAQDGKPERKEYDITPKGIQTLKDWLEQPVEQIPVERNEVLLKLFFGSHQDPEHTIHLLNDYKQKLEARHHTYETIIQVISSHQNERDSMYWLFTLDYGMRKTIASIEWCTATMDQIVKRRNEDE